MKIAFAFPFSQLALWLVLAIAAIAVIVVLLKYMETRRKDRVKRFVEADLAPRLLAGYDARARRPMFWFTVLGFIGLILALAQPRWGQSWLEVKKQSRDIVVCLDTSESMRAVNPMPNRLERAKQKVVSIMNEASGDRFALVPFSGAAELMCPLTNDHGYYRSILNAIDTDTISMEGTDIADALREASKVFKDEAEKTGDFNRDSRAILVISDGEQVSGDAVKEAEEAVKYARVYVIGVGDPNGAEIVLPEWMEKYTGRTEKRHLSKLDEEALSKLAVIGKGGYTRSTPNNNDIKDIYELIGKYQARNVSSDVRMRLVNRYQWPLAFAILMFAAEGIWLAIMPLLRSRRMKKGEQHA